MEKLAEIAMYHVYVLSCELFCMGVGVRGRWHVGMFMYSTMVRVRVGVHFVFNFQSS